MSVACEEFIVVFVGGGPPTGVFVIDICIGAHDVEWHNGHHAVWHYGTGVCGSEISGSDEWIDGSGIVIGSCSVE